MSRSVAQLALASRSPRRRELLSQLGVAYRLLDLEVDESPLAGETPEFYVERVARKKATLGRELADPADAVLAADTTVSLAGQLFGKPADADDARRMLSALAGRVHMVHTAVVVVDTEACQVARVVATAVHFRPFDRGLIDRYIDSGEPFGKAGAYAIQGLGGALVRSIEGSYSAVVGLPLAETAVLLDGIGIPHGLSDGDPLSSD